MTDPNMGNVLAIILAGGVGERLHPLTRNRAKPAVPFGGIYRIVDFTLSNCVNSGCRRVFVLVQYKSLSLIRHINMAWNIMCRELGEFIEVIPAQKRINENWYLGTADAIYQNFYSIEPENPELVLVLSGDHIYKMNYRRMIEFHQMSGADVTIGVIETPISEASRFGVLDTDRSGRITGFEEKPAHPKPMPQNPKMALVSMGVYLFNRDVLKQACAEDAGRDTTHDFGRDVIPSLIHTHRVYGYIFQDENKKQAKYWRDIGTIDAYWESNMDLVAVEPIFNLYDREWPLRTLAPTAPPAKFVFADEGVRYGAAVDSIVSPGCIVSGGMAIRSVLSPEVRINSYSQVEESILLRGCNIGRYSRIRKAIIEKYVQIPPHTVIGYDREEDERRFHVTPSGIVVVEQSDAVRLAEEPDRMTSPLAVS